MEHNFIIITPENKTGQRDNVLLGPIAKALRSATGRAALAASMVAPIRRSLDYHNIARRTFLVEQLPQGALPTYDKDIDVSSMVISKGDKDGI